MAYKPALDLTTLFDDAPIEIIPARNYPPPVATAPPSNARPLVLSGRPSMTPWPKGGLAGQAAASGPEAQLQPHVMHGWISSCCLRNRGCTRRTVHNNAELACPTDVPPTVAQAHAKGCTPAATAWSAERKKPRKPSPRNLSTTPSFSEMCGSTMASHALMYLRREPAAGALHGHSCPLAKPPYGAWSLATLGWP